jgi:hypothetical protein
VPHPDARVTETQFRPRAATDLAATGQADALSDLRAREDHEHRDQGRRRRARSERGNERGRVLLVRLGLARSSHPPSVANRLEAVRRGLAGRLAPLFGGLGERGTNFGTGEPVARVLSQTSSDERG